MPVWLLVVSVIEHTTTRGVDGVPVIDPSDLPVVVVVVVDNLPQPHEYTTSVPSLEWYELAVQSIV